MRTDREPISEEKLPDERCDFHVEVASEPHAALFRWGAYVERVENGVGFFVQALLILALGFMLSAYLIEQLVIGFDASDRLAQRIEQLQYHSVIPFR